MVADCRFHSPGISCHLKNATEAKHVFTSHLDEKRRHPLNNSASYGKGRSEHSCYKMYSKLCR